MKEIEKFFVLVALIVLGAICLKLSKNFNLPLDVALKMTLFIIGTFIVGACTLYCHLMTEYRYAAPLGYPITMVLFVNIFSPVLQYKAALVSMYADIPFWGADWFYVLINIMILFFGYGVIYWIRKD
ncbi:hypothetical protein VXS05_17650 [Photobacterium toruni]|uniref:hypothetical protein n=1 Tax=Photobacterium toruni TaxID=1935446 RepID=UPI002E16C686|nr:hypothetical protein [Photobacterium toruni]